MDKKYLCYEDFGAKGDGKTDDLQAIIACHEEANRTGIPVKTNNDATYYISSSTQSAIIKTDVDFCTSKFIIDDTALENRNIDIFVIASDFSKYNLELTSLNKEQKTLDIPHNGDNLYVHVFNENHKIFIRKGLNMNAGTAKRECFTVDKHGNIAPSIDWDYNEITNAYAKCTDDTPITITGGIFTTIANQEESFYRYHSRGIVVNRSHVTIKNITHYVTGEIEHGAPYAGFIRASEVIDFTIIDSLLTPHFIYQTPSKIPGKLVSMGSYDINFSSSIDIKCINLNQTIDIMDRKYWGLYTSNFCKKLYLENCKISRFDAHQGVSGVTIKNCTLGHQCLNLIGFGEAIIENTEAYGNAFANLRPDYGSLWNGNLTIRNCKWTPLGKNLSIISASNDGTHDFGYVCTMPNKILIDGLEILDASFTDTLPQILPIYDKDFSKDKPYPYKTPSLVVIKNIKTESGRDCILCQTPELYEGIETVFES